MELSDRKRSILRAIINDYVETAEPVGSKAIAGHDEINFSSATIRNEMSELEEMGLLDKPHTSAGRVPSTLGYRVYVDELMHRYRLTLQEVSALNRALSGKLKELDRLVFEAGRIAADITNYASVSVSPRFTQTIIKRLDLIPVDACSAVAVVVTSAGIVKNKMLFSQTPADENAVYILARMLNAAFANVPLDEYMREKFATIEREAGDAACFVRPLRDFILEIFEISERPEVYISGTSKLLNHPEYHDVEKAQRLLSYLNDHPESAGIAPAQMPGMIKISIGQENAAEPLRDASMVYVSYKLGDGATGIVGIIGPTRMNYSKVAARLRYFADGITRLLSDGTLDAPPGEPPDRDSGQT